eukprot:747476-Pyramimonas_sp.AAC.1
METTGVQLISTMPFRAPSRPLESNEAPWSQRSHTGANGVTWTPMKPNGVQRSPMETHGAQ